MVYTRHFFFCVWIPGYKIMLILSLFTSESVPRYTFRSAGKNGYKGASLYTSMKCYQVARTRRAVYICCYFKAERTAIIVIPFFSSWIPFSKESVFVSWIWNGKFFLSLPCPVPLSWFSDPEEEQIVLSALFHSILWSFPSWEPLNFWVLRDYNLGKSASVWRPSQKSQTDQWLLFFSKKALWPSLRWSVWLNWISLSLWVTSHDMLFWRRLMIARCQNSILA